MMALYEIYQMTIYFLKLLFIFFSGAYCENISEYNDIKINTTEVQNVTTCFSRSAYIVAVFNESSTWTEAEYSCKQKSYNRLYAANAGRRQWFHVRDVLKFAGFPENTSFWEGHIRPYFHVTEWYRFRGGGRRGCENFSSSIITGDVNQFHQCAAVQWDTYYQQQHLKARNCSDMLPYICFKNKGSAHFLLYDGFMFAQHNLSEIKYKVNDTLRRSGDCAQACRNQGRCISFTFNHTCSNCTMTEIMYGFGPVMYQIIPGFVNITHGVKSGCSVSVSNAPRNFSVSGVNSTLASCGLSPIPANYCQFTSSSITNVTVYETELEQVVNELINNLTVSPDSVSAHQRKYTSATDLRQSATFFGTVGIIIITVVISLPVLSDILTLYWRAKARGKNRKRRNKNTETLKADNVNNISCHVDVK